MAKFDVEEAGRRGYIPAAPIRRIVNQWAEENWEMDFDARITENPERKGASSRLAEFVEMNADTIMHLREGRNNWIDFDMADRIVTHIDFMLWHTDPELSEIYQGFDFSNLDLFRPPSPESDELGLLDGLSNRHAAAVLGVRRQTIEHQRLRRETAA